MMVLNPAKIPLNVKSNLNHQLDTKNVWISLFTNHVPCGFRITKILVLGSSRKNQIICLGSEVRLFKNSCFLNCESNSLPGCIVCLSIHLHVCFNRIMQIIPVGSFCKNRM